MKRESVRRMSLERRAAQGEARGDLRGAFAWALRAARAGHENEMVCVGFALHEGKGVRKDFKKAVAWYRKAASRGAVAALWNLGLCYQDGHGVHQSLPRAVFWFRKAAAKGHVEARSKLRRLLAQKRAPLRDAARVAATASRAQIRPRR